MSLMIISYTKLNYEFMANNFNKYLGDIFNLATVDLNKFNFIKNISDQHKHPQQSLWRESWSPLYLQELEKKIMENQNCTFLADLSEMIYNPDLFKFVEKINPTIINVSPSNELYSLKKVILKMNNHKCKISDEEISPFIATFDQFNSAYQSCVNFPKLAKKLFSIKHCFTFSEESATSSLKHCFTFSDESDAVSFNETEFKVYLKKFDIMLNEEQVTDWYLALKN